METELKVGELYKFRKIKLPFGVSVSVLFCIKYDDCKCKAIEPRLVLNNDIIGMFLGFETLKFEFESTYQPMISVLYLDKVYYFNSMYIETEKLS